MYEKKNPLFDNGKNISKERVHTLYLLLFWLIVELPVYEIKNV